MHPVTAAGGSAEHIEAFDAVAIGISVTATAEVMHWLAAAGLIVFAGRTHFYAADDALKAWHTWRANS